MRRRLLLANWKLNHTVAQAQQFARALRGHWANGTLPYPNLDVGIAPPATSLYPLAQALAGSGVDVAAQALFAEDRGAYTGALSGPLLAEAGASYVLVGHSERRQRFGDTVAATADQRRAAVRAGLCPVLCVGEDAAERQGGRSAAVVCAQLAGALAGEADTRGGLVVAYEPVWAIGRGTSANPDEVASVLAALRAWLNEHLGPREGPAVRLLYGGSVKPDNLASLLGQAHVDGALIGGASLEVEAFAQMVAHAGG